MNETILHVDGNLTADPELRFTPSGIAVCNFTVAATERRFDKATGGWVDQPPIFMRCTAWKRLAENIAESLTRGMAVMVSGTLKTNSYETREGEKRTSLELTAQKVGVDLQFGTAKFVKAERTGGKPASGDAPQSDDPWANVRGSQKPAGSQASTEEPPFDDEPPF
jgi:single-strand DNA-binding protein